MAELANLHLLRPHWLWLALPALLLGLLMLRRHGRGGDWQQVIEPHLLPYLLEGGSAARRSNPMVWLLPAWLLAVLAAAGPSWQRLPQPVLQRQDALVVLLDLSYSMWAQDVTPSRIEVARRKVIDLLELRTEGQTALIAYAGDAHIVTPLTDDTQTIANLVPVLDPGMMPVAGARADAAVELGLELLRSAAQREGHLLLISDEIDADESRGITDLLDASPHTLSVLAVGTPTGAPIPLPEGGFLKREDGSIVLPQLQEQPMRALATRHGGRYTRFAVDDADLRAVLAAHRPDTQQETRELSRLTDGWQDMAHWFVLPLLSVLLYCFRRGVLLALLPLVFGVLPAPGASASVWDDLWLRPDQQGTRALAEGQAERARELFTDPRWRGTAAYAAGDMARAAENFAADTSADGWYNRGNALARAGELEAAAAAYRESLARSPDRTDAIENLRAVEEALQAQQDKPPQQQPADGNDQEQDESAGEREGEENPSAADGEQDGADAEPSAEQRAGDSGAPDTADPSQRGSGAASEGGAEPALDERQERAAQERTAQDRAADGAADTSAAEAAAQAQQDAIAERTARSLAEDLEREQALQQWLRRVPDDPAGLLREKFRYESRRRERRGETNAQKKIW